MTQNLNPAVTCVLSRLHYPLDAIPMCVRWYPPEFVKHRNHFTTSAAQSRSVDGTCLKIHG